MRSRAIILAWGFATFMSVLPARGVELRDGDSESESARPEHPYLRVVLGELAFLGLQSAWYWGHQEPSESQVPAFTWSTWRTELFSDRYVVFDHDRFNTNAIGHPFAGTVYYQIARGNGFGVAASFVTTVAASTLWKLFGEPNLAIWLFGYPRLTLGNSHCFHHLHLTEMMWPICTAVRLDQT